MRIVNIGLIGLGGMGKIHLHNSILLKNAKLLAVADVSKKSRSLANAKGVKKAYDDYEKLLENPTVDCVIISLPNYLHRECAIKAVENGKHIFIEKPLARSVEEGKEIVSKARKAGVKTMVGYPLRFTRLADIKEEIDNGHLGDVVTAIATCVNSGPFSPRMSTLSVPSPVPSWWFEPELVGGGALLDVGSHMIDLLLFYFGEEIASVRALLGHRFNLPLEDHALCFVKFKQGVSAIVNVGWFSQEIIMKIELCGTATHVCKSIKSPTLLDYAKRIVRRQPLSAHPSFQKELQHFVDCVRSDTSPSPSAEEGLQTLKAISTVYKHASRIV